ncbi:SH3 domain-containing C40 family peptidase [Helicobacter sp.]|uniref:SH3 domain-containing C40 family peptidase n=1 Tax=Helicobacter sp. TaxID=218 RepID=UPI0025BE101E|nr:SH3 domain-containing C40 family peptidase [Helicobacter sp.]MBR2494286.1 SH3 domain-containing protein [Helicobacter sp.]
MARIYLVALCVMACLLTGCAKRQITTIAKDVGIYPQDARFYLMAKDEFADSSFDTRLLKKAYLKAHFSPWFAKPNPDVKGVFWVRNSLQTKPGFGENRLPNSKEFTQGILDSMDIARYPSAAQRAIITESTNVRVVPSEKMRFDTEDDFPFDQWQNSWIFANTPVLVTHYDKTKRWAHIQSGFVSGWILVSKFGLVGDKQITQLKNASYILPKRDNIPLYHKGKFLTNARLGQILPMVKSLKDHSIVLVAVRDMQGRAQLVESSIATQDMLGSFPRTFSQVRTAELINVMLGDKYGWGGYLASRDCSAFIRDIFANYGLYLPRNSLAQAQVKKSMQDLSHLNRKQKERYIIEHGVPFGSVLYLKGHIMLYIGEHQGRAMVAHSAWSVKTSTLFRKYKNMLGGVVVTSLYAGKEHNGLFSKTLLIDRIVGITNLYSLLDTSR